jgi:hypothetical protein
MITSNKLVSGHYYITTHPIDGWIVHLSSPQIKSPLFIYKSGILIAFLDEMV